MNNLYIATIFILLGVIVVLASRDVLRVQREQTAKIKELSDKIASMEKADQEKFPYWLRDAFDDASAQNVGTIFELMRVREYGQAIINAVDDAVEKKERENNIYRQINGNRK